MSFFFNATATTEIYTYLHTLSLHDALPSSPPGLSARRAVCSSGFRANSRTPTTGIKKVWLAWEGVRARLGFAEHGGCRAVCARPRSEEHTSELQSLMRNSYAVFCLKKKRTQHT